MAEETILDVAHAAMEAAPEDDAARLRFYERLADAELFLLLQAEAEGDQVMPETFEMGDARFVLLFDRENRLTAFTGTSAPYAAMSGRVAVGLLAEQGLGLALNPEVAPSTFLLPPEGVAWLAETVAQRPDEVEQEIDEVLPPVGLPEVLLAALDTKLATATGLAASAYLVGVAYRSALFRTRGCGAGRRFLWGQ